MKPPAEDLSNRRPVWDQLQMIFMDTDPSLELPAMARACAESPYSLQELEAILFRRCCPPYASTWWLCRHPSGGASTATP